MRLLLTVSYNKILFAKGADVSAIIAALDGAKIVEESGSWSGPKKYIPKDDVDLQATLINDDNVMLPEVNDGGVFEKFHKLTLDRDELRRKNYELEEKLKKISEQVAVKK